MGAIMPVMLHADCMGGGGKRESYRDVTSWRALAWFRDLRSPEAFAEKTESECRFWPAPRVRDHAKPRMEMCVWPQFYRAPEMVLISSPTGVLGIFCSPMRLLRHPDTGGSWPLQWESADVPSADDRWGVGSHDAKKLIGGASERASECEKKWWAHFGDGYGCTRVSGKTRALSPLKETGLIFFRGGVCVETGSLRRRLTSVRGNRTNPMACLLGPEMARAMVPLGYYFRRILLGLDSAGARQPDMVPPPET